MRRRIAIAFCLALMLAIATAPGAPRRASRRRRPQGFSQIGAPRALKGAAGIYEWHFVAERGPSPFDRIGLHRIASGPAAPAHPGIVMLYLPGTNMNGEVAIDDQRYSMPLYLAAHGVDVWAMDYRTHFVPPDTPAEKLAVMAGWTNRVFEGDIEAAAAFVSAKTHNEKLFIAGFSRGASFAYLFAAMHPQSVAGLVILDGFIPRRPAAAMPAGRVADDIGGRHLTYDKRRALMEAVIRDPGGPAPLPKYKTRGGKSRARGLRRGRRVRRTWRARESARRIFGSVGAGAGADWLRPMVAGGAGLRQSVRRERAGAA